jgi:hypothetical protein
VGCFAVIMPLATLLMGLQFWFADTGLDTVAAMCS